MKERVEKGKMKRREVAEKKQTLEEKEEAGKTKETEKEMWNRLNELNK